MKRLVFCSIFTVLGLLIAKPNNEILYSHDLKSTGVYVTVAGAAGVNSTKTSEPAVSGQGEMRFKVLYTSAHLPEKAKKVLVSAHGGFAVDRRQGHGETYFALPGAGIIQISSEFKTSEM